MLGDWTDAEAKHLPIAKYLLVTPLLYFNLTKNEKYLWHKYEAHGLKEAHTWTERTTKYWLCNG